MSGPHREQGPLAEPMASRWSPSVFDATHVITLEQVELLLAAARWAPSCGNAQPARFVVAPRGGPSHQVLVRHLSRGNSGWVPRASLVLVAGTQWAPDEAGEGGFKPAYADVDLGQSVAHLTLQAQAMGLVTHQFAGFDQAAFGAEVGVPDQVRLLVGIAVGLRGDPADVPVRDAEREHKPRHRRGDDTMAHGARWGRPWRAAWPG